MTALTLLRLFELPGVGSRRAGVKERLVRLKGTNGYVGAWAALLVSATLIGCRSQKRDRYYLPDGFDNFVHIRFGVPSAPPLAHEEGFRLIHVPPSGEVSTSSPMIPGEGYLDEYICLGKRQRNRIPKRGWTSGEPGGVEVWTVRLDCNDR